MSKFRSNSIDLRSDLSGRKCYLTLEIAVNKETIQGLEKIKNLTDLDIDIKKHREHRSMNANSYMWVLLDKMAKQLDNGETKESLYQDYIKAVGVFTPLPIKAEGVERFRRVWSEHGIGWVLQVVDDSKLDGYKLVHAYHGSSTYNTEEMTTLINLVVEDAKELGVDTRTPNEIAEMLSLWNTQKE